MVAKMFIGVSAAVLSLSLPLHASNEQAVAILQISGDAADDALRTNLVDAVAVELSRWPGTRVITRNEINSMLGLEKLKDATGCSDMSCLAEIGGALGVERLVAGTLAHQSKEGGDFYSLTLQLVDTKHAEVLRRETAAWDGKPAGLYQLLPSTVLKLMAGPAAEGYAGQLVVTTSVIGAQILVDGKMMGRTPMMAPLSAPIGKIVVDIVADEYEPFKQIAIVDKDRTTALVVSLVEKPKPPIYARWWFWPAAAAVVGGGITAGILATRSNNTGSGSFTVTVPNSVANGGH